MPVLYVFLCIISFIFYVLYKEAFSFYLFAFFLILPIVLFVFYIYASKKIKVNIVKFSTTKTKNNKVPINISVENPTIVPITNMKIVLEITTSADNENNVIKINTPVHPRDKQGLQLAFIPAHCGKIKCTIKKCKICDFLKLFRFSVKSVKKDLDSCSLDYFIVPEYIPIDNTIDVNYELGMQTDEFSKTAKGDDPSEVFDFHEYMPGDKISRIHWKLSAKQNFTVVKDYSLPITNSILMIFDPKIEKDEENFAQMYDSLLEAFMAIARHLSINGQHFTTLFFEKGKPVIININDEHDCEKLCRKLLDADALNSEINKNIWGDILERLDLFSHAVYFSALYNEKILIMLESFYTAKKYSYMLAGDNFNDVELPNEIAQVYKLVPDKISQCISGLRL